MKLRGNGGIIIVVSKIEKLGKEKLQNIIDESNNYKEVLEKIGLSVIANNYKTLRKYILKFGVNIDGIEYRRIVTMHHVKYSKESLIKMLENGTCTLSPSKLLKKLIEFEIKEYHCERCGIDRWNGKNIVLELHHKDGNHSNNRLDNIEILCPNCHSQTDNFRYKNRKKF